MSLSNILVSNNYTLFGGSSLTGTTGSKGPDGFSITGPRGISVTGPAGINYTGKTGIQGVDVGMTGATGSNGSNVGFVGPTGASYGGIGTGIGTQLYDSPGGVAGWNVFMVTGSITGNGVSTALDIQNSSIGVADTYMNSGLSFNTKGILTTPVTKFNDKIVLWSQNQTCLPSTNVTVLGNNLNSNFYYKNLNSYLDIATGLYTAPYDGSYQVFSTCYFPNTGGTYRKVSIVNTATVNTYTEQKCAALSTSIQVNTQANWYLSAGDQIKIWIFQDTGASMVCTVNTSIWYLGK